MSRTKLEGTPAEQLLQLIEAIDATFAFEQVLLRSQRCGIDAGSRGRLLRAMQAYEARAKSVAENLIAHGKVEGIAIENWGKPWGPDGRQKIREMLRDPERYGE